MEAKHTVMTHKQRVECSHNPVLELRERDMCEAQAEISFSAGEKQGIQKGIREAVGWLEPDYIPSPSPSFEGSEVMAIDTDKLQAKLKKRGVHSGVS